MSGKPKIAFYWASSCGGCEISFVNLHEALLTVTEQFDLVFCPCLIDTKKKDIEAMPDRSIAITFFNGAIRTGENEEMAKLMRQKSGLVIAYGACAVSGGIPALSNFSSKRSHFETMFLTGASVESGSTMVPAEKTRVAEGDLDLPAFFGQVKSLSQTIDVDLFLPGCPPETPRLLGFIQHIIEGKPLPVKGSVVGAGRKSVCDECKRKKADKRISRLYRMHEIIPIPEQCLLEQGLFCMGVATRSGCGGLCPEANQPCTGCYGAPEGVADQGAKMAATIGGILDFEPYRHLPEEELVKKMDEQLAHLPDFGGMSYKYTLAQSLLKKAIDKKGE